MAFEFFSQASLQFQPPLPPTKKKSFCNILRVDFIFSALRKFGYRDKFIHMIKVAYTNIKSKVKINSLLSDPLTLMFVDHVCLLSMLLHNIVAAVLANFINVDKRIKGNRRP